MAVRGCPGSGGGLATGLAREALVVTGDGWQLPRREEQEKSARESSSSRLVLLLISLISCSQFLLPFPLWASKAPDTMNRSQCSFLSLAVYS